MPGAYSSLAFSRLPTRQRTRPRNARGRDYHIGLDFPSGSQFRRFFPRPRVFPAKPPAASNCAIQTTSEAVRTATAKCPKMASSNSKTTPLPPQDRAQASHPLSCRDPEDLARSLFLEEDEPIRTASQLEERKIRLAVCNVDMMSDFHPDWRVQAILAQIREARSGRPWIGYGSSTMTPRRRPSS